MRSLAVLFVVLSLALPFCARAADDAGGEAAPEISAQLKLRLVNERGRVTNGFEIPREGNRDVLFRAELPVSFGKPESWALDVSEPQTGRTYRLEIDGGVPPIIHWDGVFSDGKPLRPGRRYFFRLLVGLPDRVVASEWSFFSTRLAPPEASPRLPFSSLKLVVIPSGAAYLTSVQTQSMRSSLFPTLSGDVRAIWLERLTLGLRFEATSNILFAYRTGPTDFVYSDFSLFTRYRLIGSPPHPPRLPPEPPYARSRPTSLPGSAYGAGTNLELGMRFFHSVLRGYGGQAIDRELMRELEGLTGTLHFDQALGPLRWLVSAEAGYTVFIGKALELVGETALVYDHFANISPGVQLRYVYLQGTPASDPFAGVAPTQRINRVLFLGGVLYFKL